MWDFVLKYWVEFLFGLIVAGLGILYRKLSKRVSDNQSRDKAMEDGIRELLKDRIIQAHDYYVNEKRSCSAFRKASIDSMYEAYHTLGGNGTVTRLCQEIDSLPTE